MATMSLPTIELVSTMRTVPMNGSPSSQDYNDDQNESLIDLASISSFINGTLIPLLQVLPQLASTAGLEGRAINTDSTDVTALCFNAKTATPLTLADSMKYLQNLIASQQTTVTNLSSQVSKLAAQLSSTNQNSISLTLQSFQSAMNNIAAQLASLQNTVAQLQSSSGGGTTVEPIVPVTSSSTTTIDFSLGLAWKVNMNRDTSLVLTSAISGQVVKVFITQDSTGGHAVAWPSNAPGVPSPNLTAGSTTVYTFTFDGTNYLIDSTIAN